MEFILVFVILVILISSVFQLLSYLSYRGWKHIYTAFGTKDYFSIIAKLKSNGIKYRVKTISNQRNTPLSYDHTAQYEIYVKKGTDTNIFTGDR